MWFAPSFLQYCFSFMSRDETKRAEAKAIQIAEERYGGTFFSTGGVCADLSQFDLTTHKQTGIIVEVTIAEKVSLLKKMEHSKHSFAFMYPHVLLTKVVGIRIDPKNMNLLELQEMDVDQNYPIEGMISQPAKPPT